MPVTLYRGHTYVIFQDRFTAKTGVSGYREGRVKYVAIDGCRHAVDTIRLAHELPEEVCEGFIDRMIAVLGPIAAQGWADPSGRSRLRGRRVAARNLRKAFCEAAERRRFAARNISCGVRTRRSACLSTSLDASAL